MKLTKLTVISALGAALTLAVTLPIYGKGPDQAPGQLKKQQVSVGKVQKVTSDSVTLDNNTQASVDTSTKVVGQEKKILKLSQIGTNDLAAVITTQTASGSSGKATKIFVKSASSSAQVNRQAVMGIISNISGNTLTLVHQIQRNRTWTILLNSQTMIKFKSQISSQLSLLQVGQRVVVIGDASPSGLLAKWIHIIPGKAEGITKNQPPIATPSATPTATPTGTPSATPTATPSGTPTGTPSATPTI